VPKGWYGKSDVSGKHIVYPRIVLIGGEEAGEVYIPKGQGRDVLEWHEDFGIPSVTGGISYPHPPYASHFWFNPNPGKDEISGQYDVAVVILRNWHTRPDNRCVDIDAACDRWSLQNKVDDKIRFRPVRQLEEAVKEAA